MAPPARRSATARGRAASRASRPRPAEPQAPPRRGAARRPAVDRPGAPAAGGVENQLLAISPEQLRSLVGEMINAALPVPAPALQALAHIEHPGAEAAAAPAAGAAPANLPDGVGVSSVPVALRQKIVAHHYINLGLLTEGADPALEDPACLQLVNGQLRQVRTAKEITSFASWCAAFLQFAGVYLDAHPTDAIGIVSHMLQVSQLTAPGLGLAWKVFDEQFRRAREMRPELHPWGQTASCSQLWLQSVARGVGGAARNGAATAAGPSGLPAARGALKPCFAFNRHGCQSSASDCEWAHQCRRCAGPHPIRDCPQLGTAASGSKAKRGR